MDGYPQCHWEPDTDYAGYVRQDKPQENRAGQSRSLLDGSDEPMQFPMLDKPNNTEQTHFTRESFVQLAAAYTDKDSKEQVCHSIVPRAAFEQDAAQETIAQANQTTVHKTFFGGLVSITFTNNDQSYTVFCR